MRKTTNILLHTLAGLALLAQSSLLLAAEVIRGPTGPSPYPGRQFRGLGRIAGPHHRRHAG